MRSTNDLALAVAGIAMLTFSMAALPHAFILQNEIEVDAGIYHVIQIGIPHGCAGSPTHTVRIKVPEGIQVVRPEVKPGWKVSYTMRKLDPPYFASETVKLTEVADEVVWSNGHLLDSDFDRFNMMVKLPDKPGTTLYFKTIQVCDKGEHRWIETMDAAKSGKPPKEPSPFINLVPAHPPVRPLTPFDAPKP